MIPDQLAEADWPAVVDAHVAAPYLIEEFCDDSDGCAEVTVEYRHSEDGEYAWTATIVWDGQRYPPDEREPMRPSIEQAVVAAINRFFLQYPTPAVPCD